MIYIEVTKGVDDGNYNVSAFFTESNLIETCGENISQESLDEIIDAVVTILDKVTKKPIEVRREHWNDEIPSKTARLTPLQISEKCTCAYMLYAKREGKTAQMFDFYVYCGNADLLQHIDVCQECLMK